MNAVVAFYSGVNQQWHLVLLDLGGDISCNGLFKLFLTIAAAFAEAERDRIREPVAQVKQDQRQRGRYLGGRVPYGFRVGAQGALEAIPEKQAAYPRWGAARRWCPIAGHPGGIAGGAQRADVLSLMVREAAT